MNEKVVKRKNINDVVSDFVKKNLAIAVNVPFEERVDTLRNKAVDAVNRSITQSGVDEIKTTANYAPYFSQVLLEGVHRCKVIDVVRAKRSDNLITSLVSNVHETGEMNPTLIVRGYGHAVKGLNIGDCIDINPEPGCLVRRSVIDFDDDFEAIHDYYYKRNPNMVKAVNFDKSSKVLIEGANAVDLDKPDDVVTIRFAYVIEARFITGIYYNKKTVDRAIEAFKIESVNGHIDSIGYKNLVDKPEEPSQSKDVFDRKTLTDAIAGINSNTPKDHPVPEYAKNGYNKDKHL